MTFKEQYSKDIDSLQINLNIRDDIIQKQGKEEKKAVTKRRIVRYGSIAACFVLLGSVMIIRVNESKKDFNIMGEMSEAEYRGEMLASGSVAAIYAEDNAMMQPALEKPQETEEKSESRPTIKDETLERSKENKINNQTGSAGELRKEILLLIPLFLLVSVMVAWTIFRKK